MLRDNVCLIYGVSLWLGPERYERVSSVFFNCRLCFGLLKDILKSNITVLTGNWLLHLLIIVIPFRLWLVIALEKGHIYCLVHHIDDLLG